MINFNFSDITFDWAMFKKIRKRDVFFIMIFVMFLVSFFRVEIERYIDSNTDLITNRLVQKELVTQKLEEIRRRNNCQYVAINLFHNGTTAINGTHFAKMTREYEARALNKLPLSYKLQSYDITPFSNLLLQLKIDGTIYIPDVLKFEDEYTKNMLLYFGCKSVFYVALIEDKKFVGFMTFEYEKTTNFDEKKLESLRKEIHLVEKLVKK
jgi:hypothetical protein